MKKMKDWLKAVRKFSGRYKYVITIVVGVCFVGFIGDNSFLQQVKNMRQISRLEKEIETYDERFEADSIRLCELFSNPEAIEKIARERYFMKADNEDIFVLSDDERPEEPGL